MRIDGLNVLGFLLAGLAASMPGVQTVNADTIDVTLTITGNFSTAGTNTIADKSGKVSITFTPPENPVLVSFSDYGASQYVPIGTLTIARGNSNSASLGLDDIIFNLVIKQIAPSGESATLQGNLSGRLMNGRENAQIDFPDAPMLGNITYRISDVLLPNPDKNSNSQVGLFASIVSPPAPVPEPSLLILLGAGIVAVGVIGWSTRR